MKTKLFFVVLLFFSISTLKAIDEVNWVKVSEDLNIDRIIKAIAFNSRGHVFAGTAGKGVYRSIDNGESWSPVNTGIGNTTSVLSLLTDDQGNIFAGTSRGDIYRSTNNGESWTISFDTGGSFNQINGLTLGIKDDIYAATSNSEVFRSTDNGNSWQKSDGPPDFSIWSIIVNKNGALFIGTMGNGVYRSSDGGLSWDMINEGLPIVAVLDVHTLAISNNEKIYAGTLGYGIYKSADYGDNWTEINTGLGNMTILKIIYAKNGDMIAGTNSGIFLRNERAGSWTEISGDQLAGAKVYSPSLNINGYLFAGTDQGEIYRSADQLYPSEQSLSLNVEPAEKQVLDWGNSVEYSITILDDEKNPVESATVVVEDDLLDDNFEPMTGSDGKASYSSTVPDQMENGNYNITFQALKDGYEKSMIIKRIIEVKHENGVDAWENITNNLPDKRVRALAVSNGGTVFAGISSKGVYRSDDNGDNWVNAAAGLMNVTSVLDIAIGGNGDIFIATDWDGVCKSTNNGESWLTTIIPDVSNAHALAISGETIIAATQSGVFRSSDNGSDWEEFNAGLNDTDVTDLVILNVNHVYAAAGAAGVYYSPIDNAAWNAISDGLSGVSAIQLAAGSAGDIFAGTSANGMYLKKKYENAWNAINSGIEDFKINDIVIGDNRTVYICSFGNGTYYSDDDGITWTEYNEGFESLYFMDVFSLAAGNNGFIFAGAFATQSGGGCFRRKISAASIDDFVEPAFVSVYPNPFYHSTVINYQLTETSNLVLKVFDIFGNEIAVLADGTYKAGRYRTIFNGAGLPEGIYFYRLQLNGRIRSGKLVLVR